VGNCLVDPLPQEVVMNGRVALEPVDVADVTIVVDNFLDVLMPSTEIVQLSLIHI